MKKTVLGTGASLGGLALVVVLAGSAGLFEEGGPAKGLGALFGGSTDTVVAPVETQAAAPVEAAPAPRVPAMSRGQARKPSISPTWVDEVATATGIPAPAVRAYGRAVLTAPEGCALGWTTLAGIGWVESQHGTMGERTLAEDGRPSSAILGPPLDGQQFAAIPATPESTALHGDPLWDRAMGPMQFIPSTWKQWATDGDGDGLADPHDVDDASAAAAAYLCHDGHDLSTASGWNAAVFSYNHDNAYVVAVHAAADGYGRQAG